MSPDVPRRAATKERSMAFVTKSFNQYVIYHETRQTTGWEPIGSRE